ncbi:hypothetical protein MHU86_921 [Fragilaria crotonensis]|nr:hypothetical protein MHU86_921 [Fragilaria crotonensis]
MKRFTISFLLLCVGFHEGSVAFAPSPTLNVRGKDVQKTCHSVLSLIDLQKATTRTAVVCQQSQTPNEIYGIERGYPILAFFFLLSAWFFTIPPQFRRARFCASDICVQTRCNDCVTVTEWVTGIQDYYRNGGGIKWDFSIDPSSKMN